MKTAVAAALARGTDPVFAPLITSLPLRMAVKHATPDTLQFGEVMVVVNGPKGRTASQRVATPHLWEGILFYLTAMALEDPGAFDRYNKVLPASRVPPPDVDCPIPAACTGDCDGSGSVSGGEVVLLANLALDDAGVATCSAGDANGDGRITIDEILAAVNNVMIGCGT